MRCVVNWVRVHETILIARVNGKLFILSNRASDLLFFPTRSGEWQHWRIAIRTSLLQQQFPETGWTLPQKLNYSSDLIPLHSVYSYIFTGCRETVRCGNDEVYLKESNNWWGQKIRVRVVVLSTLWVDNADVETSGQHYIAIEAHLTEFRAPHLVNFRL